MRYEKELQYIEERYKDAKLTNILRTPFRKEFKNTYVFLELGEEVLPKFNPKIEQLVFTATIHTHAGEVVMTVKYILPKT